MSRPAPPPAALATRVATLEAVFDDIARTRFAGLGLLHPGLRVQALGFEPEPDAPQRALGVLVTPWFMNLLRLPLVGGVDIGTDADLPAPGASQPLTLAGQTLDFIGAHEDRIGHYALCSLFSPMADFADQAAAVATAQAVLQLLRPAPAAEAMAPAAQSALIAPARRGFLFGRPAGGAR